MKLVNGLSLIAAVAISASAGIVRAQTPAPTSRPAVAAVPSGDTVAFLGVSTKPVTADLRTQLQLPEGLGLTVQTVGRNTPAADQLKAGDVLQKMDDQLLVNADQLQTLVRMHKPGDTIKLTIIRETKPVEVSVKLGETVRRPAAAAVGFDQPDPFTIPDGPNLALANGLNNPGVANMSMAFSDGTYSAHVETDKDGHKQLTVKDNAGAVVASGQVDTEDQWKALPADVQTHLKVLNNILFHPRRPAVGVGVANHLQVLQNQRATLQAEVDQLATELQADNPRLKAARLRLEGMDRSIAALERAVNGQAPAAGEPVPAPNTGDRP